MEIQKRISHLVLNFAVVALHPQFGMLPFIESTSIKIHASIIALLDIGNC